MSSDELPETHEITVRYDPDEIGPDAIEDYLHEMVHMVDYVEVAFTNTERFEYL